MRHQAILAGNHVVAGEGLQDHEQERVGFTEFLAKQGDRRIGDLKNASESVRSLLAVPTAFRFGAAYDGLTV